MAVIHLIFLDANKLPAEEQRQERVRDDRQQTDDGKHIEEHISSSPRKSGAQCEQHTKKTAYYLTLKYESNSLIQAVSWNPKNLWSKFE